MNYPTILDTIGETPLVKLQHIVPNPLATILVKVEFMNPGSSIKDRIVKYIIEDAEKKDCLSPVERSLKIPQAIPELLSR